MSDSEQITPGAAASYVPAADFALDRAADGGACWAFAYADERGGDVPADELDVKKLRRGKSGELTGARGRRPVKPARPRVVFAARVVAALEDGLYEIDADDPNGCATHHLTAAYDPHKAPGTFHLEGE